MEVLATLMRASLPSLSTLVDICSAMNLHASLHARRYPAMTVVGWILLRTSSFARLRSSEARRTTEVVPSPTSLSCCVASETRMRAYCQLSSNLWELTEGCETSRRERMVAPSLVMVTSPTLSTSILSRLLSVRSTSSNSPDGAERRLEDVRHRLARHDCGLTGPAHATHHSGRALRRRSLASHPGRGPSDVSIAQSLDERLTARGSRWYMEAAIALY